MISLELVERQEADRSGPQEIAERAFRARPDQDPEEGAAGMLELLASIASDPDDPEFGFGASISLSPNPSASTSRKSAGMLTRPFGSTV